jgi:hypothetical protein
MKKLILLLLFIPLVSFGQTKDAIEQGIKEIQSMIPTDADGMTLVDVLNENDTDIVYVYQIKARFLIKYFKNNLNKQTTMKNMIANNGNQWFVNNKINGVWRYYFKEDLIKEIVIKYSEYPSNNKSSSDSLFELGDYVSFKDNPKGVNIKIRKPIGWKFKDGEIKGIAGEFISNDNKFIYQLIITDLRSFTSLEVSKLIINDEMERNKLIDQQFESLKKNYKNVEIEYSKNTYIGIYPAVEVVFKVQLETAGLVVRGNSIMWMVYFEDKFIGLNAFKMSDEFTDSELISIRSITASIIFEEMF